MNYYVQFPSNAPDLNRPVFAALPPFLSLFHYSASLSCTHRRPLSFTLTLTDYCTFSFSLTALPDAA
ncbi:hypothetical protein N7505_010076 [Penicillium chrysogenum]|uniref:Uncharacterized protein n=1 Tax=Penicillium chrysogenum TaxID=5076 RepID=A0ABQ8W445_PENCH|nr:hypothetical protein N7505_010076 [Penicillium chrysogenum]